ncbi:oxidoreductase [Streptomyces sp. NBC_00820]|uniref:oxidoreductase n=1 Tax=Streptomyces sp. NBC_00820 TaxID=2975842 RepID=UPI002ED4F76E|nr:oxidoreductase [Streptomyces sp. NBC_00820]
MCAAYATFGLAPAIRAGGVLADGGHRVHRDFVDFIVDGRPLLLLLSDLDAVSPLASDVPPAVFTAQVSALLLETAPPLPDGRFVIYGCPECEDLACGAVTAVIERDGDDVVWRDFAWQTGEHADLERDGYHGTGPFRFRGPEYRTALRALSGTELIDTERNDTALSGTELIGTARIGTAPLDEADGRAGARRRVLLIGARTAVLARPAAALRAIGIGAEITPDVVDVAAEELRGYGAVVFARAVGEPERAAVREAFERAGADVAYVDERVPAVPLLVAQVEQALDRGPLRHRRLTGLAVADGAAHLEVAFPCRVRVTAYRLGRFHRTHVQEAFDGVLEAGRHRVALDPGAVRGESAVVARASGSVLVERVEGVAG